MSEMWRNLLKYFAATAAVILTTGSLLILGFWFRAFSPELYTSSLKESGIYAQTSIVIQDYVSYSLSSFGQEELSKIFGFAGEAVEENREVENKATLSDETKSAIFSGVGLFIGTLLEEQTQKLVEYAAQQIQLEQTLEQATETAIIESIAWLTTDAPPPEIFSYVPAPEQIETLEKVGLIRLAAVFIFGEVTGVSQLPECASVEQENTSLAVLAQDGLKNVPCTSPTVRAVIQKELEGSVPDKLVTALEEKVDALLDETQIQAFVDGAIEILKRISLLVRNIENFKAYVHSVRNTGVALFVASLVVVGFAVLLSEGKERLTDFLAIYLISGVFILIIGLLYEFIFSDVVVASLNIQGIPLTNDAISPARAALLNKSLLTAVNSIVGGLNDYVLLSGSALVVIAGVPLGFIKWSEHRAESEGNNSKPKKRGRPSKKAEAKK